MVSILEYSLHFATVLSRWAREYTNEVGALEVLQKICSPRALILFSEGTHPAGEGACRKMHIIEVPSKYYKKHRPAGEGACRKNAHHRGLLEVLQKNIFPPQNP